MKTKNTLNKSKSKSKRNPSPEDGVAALRALTSSAATSFGFQSNTGDSVTKMPIDGVSISSQYVCRRLIEQAAATDPLRTTEDNLRFIEVFEMIRDLQPRNTLESMLCAQMILSFGRWKRGDEPSRSAREGFPRAGRDSRAPSW